jgi:hypothetical protein
MNFQWKSNFLASSLCLLLTSQALSAETSTEQAQCPGQLKFKSDKDPSYKYLEKLQKDVYEKNPGLADPFAPAAVKSPRTIATATDLIARAKETCPDLALRSQCALDPVLAEEIFKSLPCLVLPTRYESPFFWMLVSSYMEELEKIRKKQFPTAASAQAGSLPTGTIDAQALLPPGAKQPLVIMNRDLFFFTGAFSKAISDAIPISVQNRGVVLDNSENGIRERLRSKPYIVENFADALSRLVRDGSSKGAIEITLDEIHNHIHARLMSAMDHFLIAHEEAHAILGHVSKSTAPLHVIGTYKTEVRAKDVARTAAAKPGSEVTLKTVDETLLQVQVRTREQELRADELGFKLLILTEKKANDPVGLLMAAAAPHMVFRILEAANAYGTEAGGWTFGDANHPSAQERIASLSPMFDEMSKTAPVLKQADFRIVFDAAFKMLLSEADPLIRKNLGSPAKEKD